MASTESATATTAPATTASDATSTKPPAVRRQSTIDDSRVKKLEQQLAQRPEREELQDKNILKDASVAPSLVAKAEQLKKSKMEDALNSKLSQRPAPEHLVKEGILNTDENPAEVN
ncbi:hypothetical protein SCHPADRAFT_845156 [Schizopora paradoxa]|uniref:RPEL repeat protein n=1 Tax=Schizopora paradoxa TaxID=27342 RepID=A0A0H2S352_9AGAM|nr:hypothetical protein SCHPADRAFT_845156 [Schizopora paradoxa]